MSRSPAPVVVALAALAGCGGPYALVANGGVPLSPGSCRDVVITHDLRLVQAHAADCAISPGSLVPVGATGAFWRIGDADWAGPVFAPVATVEMDAPVALANGASDKGLASGASDKGLASGASDKGLAGGASDKGLAGGASDKPVLRVEKRGSGRATTTKAARFTITVKNEAAVALSHLALVDRVSPMLRVEVSDAEATEVADGSTLVLFRSDEPLGAGEERRFVMRVYAR